MRRKHRGDTVQILIAAAKNSFGVIRRTVAQADIIESIGYNVKISKILMSIARERYPKPRACNAPRKSSMRAYIGTGFMQPNCTAVRFSKGEFSRQGEYILEATSSYI